MEIFLASGNSHKKNEIQELFPEHTFLIPKDRGIHFDPEENGNSFFENSLIKAKELWEIVHQPVIADDSGICVSILNNRPGIYSQWSFIMTTLSMQAFRRPWKDTLFLTLISKGVKAALAMIQLFFYLLMKKQLQNLHLMKKTGFLIEVKHAPF